MARYMHDVKMVCAAYSGYGSGSSSGADMTMNISVLNNSNTSLTGQTATIREYLTLHKNIMNVTGSATSLGTLVGYEILDNYINCAFKSAMNSTPTFWHYLLTHNFTVTDSSINEL